MTTFIDKINHFYFNKYIVSRFTKRKYFLSYQFKHKILWFRVYKVATRTINHHLEDNAGKGEYIYSSCVGYLPSRYKGFFKFAFVRDPVDKFVSAWKDKVLNQNYFRFDPETHETMKDITAFIGWVKGLDLEKCDEHLRAQYALIDLNNLDFLGRFENFENDLQYIVDHTGIKIVNMERLNISGAENVVIGEREKAEIVRIYFKDCSIFYPDRLGLISSEENRKK